MLHKTPLAALAVLLLVSSSACGGNKSTSPSDTTPHTQQPANENGYEPLGTRHYLHDDNGNATQMWAELVSISPLRGSRIVYAPFLQQPDCSKDCYSVTVKFGSTASGLFQAGFSMTENGAPTLPGTPAPGMYTFVCSGQVPVGGGSGQCSAGPGAGPNGSINFTTFEFPARLLTVIGQYLALVNGSFVTIHGKTSFETGYQPLQ